MNPDLHAQPAHASVEQRLEIYKTCKKSLKPYAAREVSYKDVNVPDTAAPGEKMDYLLEMNRIKNEVGLYNSIGEDGKNTEDFLAEKDSCFSIGKYTVAQNLPDSVGESYLAWLAPGEIYVLPAAGAPVAGVNKNPQLVWAKRKYGEDWQFVASGSIHGWTDAKLKPLGEKEYPVPDKEKIIPFPEWQQGKILDRKIDEMEKAENAKDATTLEKLRQQYCPKDFTREEIDGLVHEAELIWIDSNTWGDAPRVRLAQLCGEGIPYDKRKKLEYVKLMAPTCTCYEGDMWSGFDEKKEITSPEQFPLKNSKGKYKCYQLKYHVSCTAEDEEESAGEERGIDVSLVCPNSCLSVK